MNFNGNTEEAFEIYESVFGGAFSRIIRFKDLASNEFPVADHEANKIMHIAFPTGSPPEAAQQDLTPPFLYPIRKRLLCLRLLTV